MSQRQHFENATAAIAQWFDGLERVRRDAERRGDASVSWVIDLSDEFLPVPWVRLVLPGDFPVEPCRFEVEPQLELKLPHVERGGKLCLGIEAHPGDLAAPEGAVLRALEQLCQGFLDRLQQTDWAQAEFHRERQTYWSLHCTDKRRPEQVRRRLGLVHFDVTGLDAWSYGAVAGYLDPTTTSGRFYRHVVACGDNDPDAIAQRHGWALGTVVKGRAVIVRLPDEQPWTPTTWPTNVSELDNMLAAATGAEASLTALLDKARQEFRAYKSTRKFRTTRTGRQVPRTHAAPQLFVLLVQASSVYGFQVLPGAGPTLRGASIHPFEVQRMDPDWSLARDHALPQLHTRRSRRILLIGTGSLGSVVAYLLARAGVGTMTLLDSQIMEAENTSRHVLDLRHAGHAKAPALADEIRRAVPGIDVKGIRADAASWLARLTDGDSFDLVVDCSAERSIRQSLTLLRGVKFEQTPVIHAWLEPMCSAGHVILSQPDQPWPIEDPANDLVNASDLSVDETRVSNPACSAGFHPYGAADVTQVAAFAVERILTALDEPSTPSTVWSWVRSQAFFDSLPMPVNTRSIVPQLGGKMDCATVTRSLRDVLG